MPWDWNPYFCVWCGGHGTGRVPEHFTTKLSYVFECGVVGMVGCSRALPWNWNPCFCVRCGGHDTSTRTVLEHFTAESKPTFLGVVS